MEQDKNNSVVTKNILIKINSHFQTVSPNPLMSHEIDLLSCNKQVFFNEIE